MKILKSFESILAFKYLKSDKNRFSIFNFALTIIFIALFLFGLNHLFNPINGSHQESTSKFIPLIASIGVVMGGILFFLFFKIKKKLLFFLGSCSLFPSLILLFLIFIQLTNPFLLPKILFGTRYMILALLLIGILVFIFGVILIIFNVFSTISIFSVFLGTSTMVVVLSVLGGLEGEQKNQILDFSPHIIIAGHNHKNIAQQGEIKKRIKTLLQQNNLEYSMSPYLEEEVLLKSISFEATQGIILRGIDPQSPSFDLEGHLKNGTILNLSKKNILKWVDPTVLSIAISGQEDLFSFLPRWPGNFPGIIISEEQSKTLGLSLGNTVDVISPKTTMSPTGPVPRILRFRVAGIYSTKHFKYDLKFAFTSLNTIQKFSKKKDTVSGFEIRLDNKEKIDDFANQVRNKFSPTFKIDTWKTKNRALFNAMKLEKIVMFIILVVMILVAAFSITANLIMVVIDKKQEISIIKSMGSNNFSIKKIFVMQGFFVGLIGLILGLTGGLSICIYLATIGIKTSENIFVSARIPVSVNTMDIILISLSAIILAVAATLYPSWKASSVSPVEGLNKIE